MAKMFAKDLSLYGLTIVSGMAEGIDSFAHTATLEIQGKTIAVLPCGFNNIFPHKNIKLYQQILENNGLVISEYKENEKATSDKFIARNRIVASFSIGTLVVEGGYRSGTSVTARFTKQNEKPVFCVPSSLENIKGKLTNQLIQNGAKLVRNAEDIIEEINKINPEIAFYKKEVKTKNLHFDISPELLNVYKEITDIPKDLNQISRKTGLSISEVNYKTMMLQLENKIIELPGQRFIRNDN